MHKDTDMQSNMFVYIKDHKERLVMWSLPQLQVQCPEAVSSHVIKYLNSPFFSSILQENHGTNARFPLKFHPLLKHTTHTF